MVTSSQNFSTVVGLCLLPSELIQNILFQLALPEILRLKSVSKTIAAVISEGDFVREYNYGSSLSTWLFIFKRRWRHDAVLNGFDYRSNRWFKIAIANYLFSNVYPMEDLYFLAASGNIFLFVSNTSQVVISVNLVTRTVKRIPPSPLGPRGTSSWRRSGMKLVAGSTGSDDFQFMFAELHEDRPILFMYESMTDKWCSVEARENNGKLPSVGEREGPLIFLNVINRLSESLIIAVGFNKDDVPMILRPRFDGGGNEEPPQSTVGFSWGNLIDRIHVYGDGYMMVIRSDGVDDANKRVRMLISIELWGLSLNGSHWELIAKVPNELMEKINKHYGVIMGCLEERNGIIRAVLMSNFEGKWDIIWLSFDVGKCQWTWVPLPDCKMEGANMAGIAFSSGLRLS